MQNYYKPLVMCGLLLIFNCVSVNAQLGNVIRDNKDKINNTKNKAKDGYIKDVLEGAFNEKIRNMRGDYDTANFSYTVALTDNAGMFEDAEKFEKNKSTLLLVYDRGRNADKNLQANPLQDAQDWNQVGQMMFAGNKFKLAEGALGRAKRICENNSLTNHPIYMQAVAGLGLLYHTLGRLTEAEQMTSQAMFQRGQTLGMDNSAYASSMNNLAVLYKDMGNYTEAEKMINEATTLVIKHEGKESTPYAIVLNNKAIILQTVGRYEEAETLLKQALEVAGGGLRKKSNNYQRLLINLALLYQVTNRYNEAEKAYLQAIEIKEKRLGNNHPDYAHSLNNLAALYMLMGKYEDVEQLLLKAKGIYEKKFGIEHPAYATTISNLGKFYRVKERYDEAERLLNQALDIRSKTLGDKHPAYTESKEDLAILFWQTKRLPEATRLYLEVMDKIDDFIQAYFPAMSEAEKEKYWAQLRPTYLRFYNFASQNPSPKLLEEMYNNHLLTKALLMSETSKIRQQILQGADQDLKKQYLTWVAQKEALAKYYNLSRQEIQDQGINLDSLERATNATEKLLSERSEAFRQGTSGQRASFKALIAKLDAQSAIVDLVQFPVFEKNAFTDQNTYAAFILKQGQAEPELVLLPNGNDLDGKFFKFYRASIRARKADEMSYKNFWQPIDERLNGKTKLYLSLDGTYNQISIATLKKPNGKYIIDEQSLVLLTNAKDLLSPVGQRNQTQPSAFLLGFPDYGTRGTISALPGTKVEVEKIAALLKQNNYVTTVLLGKQATEEAIKQIQSPTILHIATHGFFIDDVKDDFSGMVFGIQPDKARQNPLLRSGLFLAGAEEAIAEDGQLAKTEAGSGVFTAYELMNLNLSDTQLAAMSACETGLGDIKAGEGVYGLQRALQIAGAQNIFMSLWQVSDQATVDLMVQLYGYYVKEKLSMSEAFRKAQLALKAKNPEPYFWGAFVLIGR